MSGITREFVFALYNAAVLTAVGFGAAWAIPMTDVAPAFAWLRWYFLAAGCLGLIGAIFCTGLYLYVRRLPPMPGLFASLTPEQRAAALAYDGDVESGPATTNPD
jgi:hypothetical protein